jgi:serine/threonine protein kinase
MVFKFQIEDEKKTYHIKSWVSCLTCKVIILRFKILDCSRWEARLQILVGIAEGLVYLHHENCENSIVHCDLKPANVLLDCDMQPKITDFGIARLVKKKGKGSIASSFVSPSGYVPPGEFFVLIISIKYFIYFGTVNSNFL